MLLTSSSYSLVDLDGGMQATNLLRDWRGTFDRGPGLPPWWPAPFNDQVGTVRSRSPGTSALSMYARGLDFHFAYDFATRTSIEAWDAVAPGSVAERVRIGQRMFELQLRAAASFPEGAVQARIDGACGPQPAHLVEYLKSDRSYQPNEYYACDEWRLLSVQATYDATLGTPWHVNVSWAGLQQSLGAIAYPLRVILLPAVDEGFPASTSGFYLNQGVPQFYTITPNTPLIAEAAVGTTSVQFEVSWNYTENGVATAVPEVLCTSNPAPQPWRFHVFVRDAANTTLYHTNSLIVGPYSFERDGEPIDVTLRICQ